MKVSRQKIPQAPTLLRLNVWIKTTPDTKGEYSFMHYLFRINERQTMLLNEINYDSKNQIVSSTDNTYNPSAWTTIIPETLSEKWYTSILKYANENTSKLKSEYKNAFGSPSFQSAIHQSMVNTTQKFCNEFNKI